MTMYFQFQNSRPGTCLPTLHQQWHPDNIQKFAIGKCGILCTFINDTTIRLSECNKSISSHPKAFNLPSGRYAKAKGHNSEI